MAKDSLDDTEKANDDDERPFVSIGFIQLLDSSDTEYSKLTFALTSISMRPPSFSISKRLPLTRSASFCFCVTTIVRWMSSHSKMIEADLSSYSVFSLTETWIVAVPRFPLSKDREQQSLARSLTKLAFHFFDASRLTDAEPAEDVKAM